MNVPGQFGPDFGGIAALDRRPVERVEREAIVHPALAAEHDAADRQLHQIVEHAPAAVRLPARVAPHVPREAEARRELVAEPQFHARLVRLIRRRVFRLRAQAEVERQPGMHGPRVLHEQADIVGLDRAFGDHVARDVVVAVRAAHAAAVVRDERAIPEQLHGRRLIAARHLVADAFDLQAGLQRVLTAPAP